MKTLENMIADEIIEFGDGDEYRRDQLVESFVENMVDAFLDDLDLDSDEAYAKIYPVVLAQVRKEIDWDAVDADLEERHQDAIAWFEELERVQTPRN